jgi:hypothetical protein
MKTPQFVDGTDATTFQPFLLEDLSTEDESDFRLIFGDWEWLHGRLGTDTIDGYYLNGSGLEGLIKAGRLERGLDIAEDRIEYNSEGDTCYLEFHDLEDAATTAEIAQELVSEPALLRAAIARARAEDLEE